MRRRRYIFVSRGLVPRSGSYPRSRRHHHLLPGGHLCIHQRYARSAQRSPPGNENHIRTHPRENDQQRSCCAYPSTPHWRSLCGDNTLYINHVPRSGSNCRASTGGRFGTAPRYGMEGVSGPHKGTTLRPLRFARSFVPLWGWGYAKPLRGSRYIHSCWRNGGVSASVDFCQLCYSR